jgi:hypothetical protein
MRVDVTIGVQTPEQVEAETDTASLPHGKVTEKVVNGGLDVPDDTGKAIAVIASAGVEVRLDLP